MKEVTLCFPVAGSEPEAVLLGLKKRGFGQGKVVGFGGKIENGETVAAAAIRELAEETSLLADPGDLRPAGQLTFFFPARPEWNHLVHVFVVRNWRGAPQESAEVQPTWFQTPDIPYNHMWDDATYWLPFVLAGQAVQAVFWYNPDNATVDRAQLAVRPSA